MYMIFGLVVSVGIYDYYYALNDRGNVVCSNTLTTYHIWVEYAIEGIYRATAMCVRRCCTTEWVRVNNTLTINCVAMDK